jgi:Uma2 family endonuclease
MADVDTLVSAMLDVTHRITVDEYHEMVERGILREDDRVELLDGRLIPVPSPSPPHSGTVNLLMAIFVRRFDGRATVMVQQPVILDNYSEPQPDLLLARRRDDAYRTAHPVPRDVLLAVEVSRSTLRFDRGEKLRAYARTGIAEVWIVDLIHGIVETYAGPRAGEYVRMRTLTPSDVAAAEAFPHDAIPVREFLG